MTQAVSFSIRLAVAARQTVVGAVTLPAPRNEVAEEKPVNRTQRRELDMTLHVRPRRVKRRTDFTGLGHDPQWVKAVLLQYHQRVSGNAALVETIQPLTLLEVLVGALEMALMEHDPLLAELQRIHPTYALRIDI
jgi:hypothetical protein